MTLQRPWGPRKAFAFWGEEELRSERAFRIYTETIDMEYVTTRARQRCGEIPGQELFQVKRQEICKKLLTKEQMFSIMVDW